MHSVRLVPQPVKPCVQLARLPHWLRCCGGSHCGHGTFIGDVRESRLQRWVGTKLSLPYVSRRMILMLHFVLIDLI